MRYTITSSQLNHFRKEGFIDFEDLLEKEKLDTLKKLLDSEIVKNPTGRDLQRENLPLIHAMHFSRLCQIASALFRKNRLRIGFTQYQHFFENNASIEEISSLSETLGGCIIDLTSAVVSFYDSKSPIDFSKLKTSCLFIVFVSEKSRYKLQEKDPYTHLLKKLGYGFGDQLTDATHPLING